MRLPERVFLTEVCPRDGFQNIGGFIPTGVKAEIAMALMDTGLRRVEITSFVSPKRIPQLADGSELTAAVRERAAARGVSLVALIPNLRGYQNALEAGVDEVSFAISVSEKHNLNNMGMRTGESMERFAEIMKQPSYGIKRRLALATCFGCPFGEEIGAEKVAALADFGLALGADEVMLADTIGRGTPLLMERVLEAALKTIPPERITLHLHDTDGLALANMLVAMERGVVRFESAAGGLGGCPYAPGASGNVATEDVVNMLEGMGIQTGVDQNKLREAVALIRRRLPASVCSHLSARWFGQTCR